MGVGLVSGLSAGLGRRRWGHEGVRRHGGAVPPPGDAVAGHPGPGDAFDEDLGGAVGEAGALKDAGYDPDPIQVAGRGVLDLTAPLGDQQNVLVLARPTGRFGSIESRQ